MKVTTKETVIEVKDVAKTLKEQNEKLNELFTVFKQRNPQGKTKEEIKAAMKLCVENMVAITVAGLNNNMIQTDEYGLLKGEANPEKFKGYTGDVNKYAKDFIKRMSKTPITDEASISDVELAKLIETPYEFKPKDNSQEEGFDENQMKQVEPEDVPNPNGETVVEVKDVEGNSVIVDKENNHIYMKGKDPDTGEETTWKKRITKTSTSWYTIAKKIAMALFNLCWDAVKSVAIFGKDIVVSIAATAGTATDKLLESLDNLRLNITQTGKNFFSNLEVKSSEAV